MSKRSATEVEDGGGDVDEREDQEQRRQQSVLDAIHVLQGALAEGATAPGFEIVSGVMRSDNQGAPPLRDPILARNLLGKVRAMQKSLIDLAVGYNLGSNCSAGRSGGELPTVADRAHAYAAQAMLGPPRSGSFLLLTPGLNNNATYYASPDVNEQLLKQRSGMCGRLLADLFSASGPAPGGNSGGGASSGAGAASGSGGGTASVPRMLQSQHRNAFGLVEQLAKTEKEGTVIVWRFLVEKLGPSLHKARPRERSDPGAASQKKKRKDYSSHLDEATARVFSETHSSARAGWFACFCLHSQELE